ncbi:MAG TPA: glycosyltransferase [Chthoniobacterales bacterium]|nr:glycosyltransferase [Chthoniobacterales bacterium]
MQRATYLLPIRRTNFSATEAKELADYFRALGHAGCDVLVVDGSPAPVFEQHAASWRPLCRHEPVDRSFGYLNDKVNGIHTGVRLAATEKIILADDDIRYGAAEIERISELLENFEVVRPQNFLSPLPWWARMEAARMLINRATLRTADYPGTCAFGRSVMLRVGPYDGDVLFDNEEIIRHFASAQATISYAVNLFVRKRPPAFRKWIEQRPRQAYEDFGLRAKTALFFSLPLFAALIGALCGWKRFLIFLAAISFAAVGVALAGWFRGTASKYFPVSVCAIAPLWILERTVSTYWALYWYFTRGGYPFGDKILSKGIGRDWISGGRIAAQAAARQPNE